MSVSAKSPARAADSASGSDFCSVELLQSAFPVVFVFWPRQKLSRQHLSGAVPTASDNRYLLQVNQLCSRGGESTSRLCQSVSLL